VLLKDQHGIGIVVSSTFSSAHQQGRRRKNKTLMEAIRRMLNLGGGGGSGSNDDNSGQQPPEQKDDDNDGNDNDNGNNDGRPGANADMIAIDVDGGSDKKKESCDDKEEKEGANINNSCHEKTKDYHNDHDHDAADEDEESIFSNAPQAFATISTTTSATTTMLDKKETAASSSSSPSSSPQDGCPAETDAEAAETSDDAAARKISASSPKSPLSDQQIKVLSPDGDHDHQSASSNGINGTAHTSGETATATFTSTGRKDDLKETKNDAIVQANNVNVINAGNDNDNSQEDGREVETKAKGETRQCSSNVTESSSEAQGVDQHKVDTGEHLDPPNTGERDLLFSPKTSTFASTGISCHHTHESPPPDSPALDESTNEHNNDDDDRPVPDWVNHMKTPERETWLKRQNQHIDERRLANMARFRALGIDLGLLHEKKETARNTGEQKNVQSLSNSNKNSGNTTPSGGVDHPPEQATTTTAATTKRGTLSKKRKRRGMFFKLNTDDTDNCKGAIHKTDTVTDTNTTQSKKLKVTPSSFSFSSSPRRPNQSSCASLEDLWKRYPHRARQINVVHDLVQEYIAQTTTSNNSSYSTSVASTSSTMDTIMFFDDPYPVSTPPAPIFVTGPGGTGKTSVVHDLLDFVSMQKDGAAMKNHVNHRNVVSVIKVNCQTLGSASMTCNTPAAILTSIWRDLLYQIQSALIHVPIPKSASAASSSHHHPHNRATTADPKTPPSQQQQQHSINNSISDVKENENVALTTTSEETDVAATSTKSIKHNKPNAEENNSSMTDNKSYYSHIHMAEDDIDIDMMDLDDEDAIEKKRIKGNRPRSTANAKGVTWSNGTGRVAGTKTGAPVMLPATASGNGNGEAQANNTTSSKKNLGLPPSLSIATPDLPSSYTSHSLGVVKLLEPVCGFHRRNTTNQNSNDATSTNTLVVLVLDNAEHLLSTGAGNTRTGTGDRERGSVLGDLLMLPQQYGLNLCHIVISSHVMLDHSCKYHTVLYFFIVSLFADSVSHAEAETRHLTAPRLAQYHYEPTHAHTLFRLYTLAHTYYISHTHIISLTRLDSHTIWYNQLTIAVSHKDQDPQEFTGTLADALCPIRIHFHAYVTNREIKAVSTVPYRTL
jgi:Cdc6-like AAA superfamily ATPase